MSSNNKQFEKRMKDLVRNGGKVAVTVNKKKSGMKREIWLVKLTDGVLDAVRYVVKHNGSVKTYGADSTGVSSSRISQIVRENTVMVVEAGEVPDVVDLSALLDSSESPAVAD